MPLAIASFAGRSFLFRHGFLYGRADATVASLAVAGLVVAAGCSLLLMLRVGRPLNGSADRVGIVTTASEILSLALIAYSVSQSLAPDTPVAALAPACPGVPVYGARYFAETELHGVNARSGAGLEYQQVGRYPAGCTLGFDGYCIGSDEHDVTLGTPDQRWLVVRDRDQFVSDAFVLPESAESALGPDPSPRCARFGGLRQPRVIRRFAYDISTGEARVTAPGAVLVGYGLATLGTGSPSYYTGALGTDASSGFSALIPPAQLAADLQGTYGKVLIGAAICLAVNVPVVGSLRAQLLTVDGSWIVHSAPDRRIPADIAGHLAEIACNSPGDPASAAVHNHPATAQRSFPSG